VPDKSNELGVTV